MQYWDSLNRSRLSRRGLLRGSAVGLAGLAGAAILGCGDDDDDDDDAATPGGTAAPTVDAAKGGGILRMPDLAPPDVFDPAATIHTVSMSFGTTTALTGLLYYNDDGVVVEHMSNMPEQSDDVTYVFTLKPGIFWHDLEPANGRAFTAEDAVFGLERFSEDVPGFVWGSSLNAVTKYEAIDDVTFRLTTSEPFAPLLSALANDFAMMVNREMREKVGDDGLKLYENLLGTGPFIRSEHIPNVSNELVRNPNYFNNPRPYLDGMRFDLITDRVARLAAFRSKQIDMSRLWSGFRGEERDSLIDQFGDDVQWGTRVSDAFDNNQFKVTEPPFDDIRVRQAFHLAIDRQALTAGDAIISGPIPQALPFWAIPQPELLTRPGYRQPKDQDLAEAKRLLDGAGYADGLEVTMNAQTGRGNAVIIQDNLRPLGVEITIEELAAADNLARRASGDFSFILAGLTGAPDPDQYLYLPYHTKGGSNFGGYSNPAVDKLADEQRRIFDPDERLEVVLELQNLVLEEVPMVMNDSSVAYPVWYSYVKDRVITSGRNQGPITQNIWLDT